MLFIGMTFPHFRNWQLPVVDRRHSGWARAIPLQAPKAPGGSKTRRCGPHSGRQSSSSPQTGSRIPRRWPGHSNRGRFAGRTPRSALDRRSAGPAAWEGIRNSQLLQWAPAPSGQPGGREWLSGCSRSCINYTFLIVYPEHDVNSQ